MFRRLALGLLICCLTGTPLVVGQEDGPPASYKEVESFQRDGEADVWRNVVVSQSITRDQLIALGRYLYAKNPRQRFNIFSDDKQFKAFMNWRLHFHKSDHDQYPWPKDWLKEHHVAVIKQVADPPMLSWELKAESSKYWDSDESTLVVFEKISNPLIRR